MSIMRCTESFIAWTPSGPVSVSKDSLLSSDDPLVKGRDRHFVAVEEYVEKLGRVQDRGQVHDRVTERATAEPDERRTVVPRPDQKPEQQKPEQKPASSTSRVSTSHGRGKKDGEV